MLLSAWRLCARLAAWSEHFRPALWNDAFRELGFDPVAVATRDIDPAARLPWDHIDGGLAKAFLIRERERALEGAPTPACAPGSCAGCGVEDCAFIRTS